MARARSLVGNIYGDIRAIEYIGKKDTDASV